MIDHFIGWLVRQSVNHSRKADRKKARKELVNWLVVGT